MLLAPESPPWGPGLLAPDHRSSEGSGLSLVPPTAVQLHPQPLRAPP